jgi:hypothetical protein
MRVGVLTMGSRTADNPQAAEWVAGAGLGASQGTFAGAAGAAGANFNIRVVH